MAQKSDSEKGEERDTDRERVELWNKDYWIKGEEHGLTVTDFRPCATTTEVQHGGGGH